MDSPLEMLDRFGQFRLLVYGDLMLDLYTHGQIERLSPEEPAAPVLDVTSWEARPGGAANVAANLRALGARVTLVGLVGDDQQGRLLDRALERMDCRLRLCPDRSRPTTVKARFLHQDRVLLRVDQESRQPASPQVCEELLDRLLAELETADGLVVSDYAKGAVTEQACQALLARARESSKPVFADMKPGHLPWVRGATLVTPNRKEAAALLALSVYPDCPEQSRRDRSRREAEGVGEEQHPLGLAARLVELLGVEAAMVTLGAEGIAVADQVGTSALVAAIAFSHPPVNLSGCGDTVTAAAALAWLAGAGWEEAASLANLAAGLVAHRREATVGVGELREFVEKRAAAPGEAAKPLSEALSP